MADHLKEVRSRDPLKIPAGTFKDKAGHSAFTPVFPLVPENRRQARQVRTFPLSPRIGSFAQSPPRGVYLWERTPWPCTRKRTPMKHMLLAVWLLGPLVFGGCGLVVVPTFREFPGPVKLIQVVDAEKGSPIATAAVHVRITRFENWFVQPPILSPGNSDDITGWEPLQQADGAFTMKRRRATGWARIWFPLPPVLGVALLDEPYAHLRVTAPAYESVVYTYSPQNPPRPGGSVLKVDNSSETDANLDEQRTLVIYLVRKATEGASAACR